VTARCVVKGFAKVKKRRALAPPSYIHQYSPLFPSELIYISILRFSYTAMQGYTTTSVCIRLGIQPSNPPSHIRWPLTVVMEMNRHTSSVWMIKVNTHKDYSNGLWPVLSLSGIKSKALSLTCINVELLFSYIQHSILLRSSFGK